MSQPVLQVTNLTKSYDQFRAVDGISFELKKGEILGLLGPNGAGKSTTIQMLLGLTTPDSGQIKYFGKDFAQHQNSIKHRINFASAYNQVQGRMTVYQNLRIYAGLYGVVSPQKRIKEVLELLEIEPHRDTLFWHLSSGQKTRVILAKSLINQPEILLLDEPTSSLDPDIVNKMIDLVRDLRDKEQVSMLFTSHNMDEVTRICDRIMFLEKGKILVTDTPLNLTKMVDKTKLLVTFDGKQESLTKYAQQKKVVVRFIRKEVAEFVLEEKRIPEVLFDLKKEKVWVTAIDIQKPNLEDVFLTIARGKSNELVQN